MRRPYPEPVRGPLTPQAKRAAREWLELAPEGTYEVSALHGAFDEEYPGLISTKGLSVVAVSMGWVRGRTSTARLLTKVGS